MTNRLSEIKRLFFQKRVANSTRMPLGQLMKDYINSVMATSKTESIQSLEIRWLQKVIADNAGTISGSHLSELYPTANLTLGFATHKTQAENEMTFYANYTP